MKKIFLVLVAMFCVATVSAQSNKWSIGARVGSGLQADAEWFYSGDKYVEGRFGMGWLAGALTADFTALHNWNCCSWDWTPQVGKWYLDAGVGANVGGRPFYGVSYVYVGVAGQAKFGIKFNKVPVRLALDWTPVIGVELASYQGYSAAGFYGRGLANLALSATYCF